MFLTLAMPEYKFQGMCGHLRRVTVSPVLSFLKTCNEQWTARNRSQNCKNADFSKAEQLIEKENAFNGKHIILSCPTLEGLSKDSMLLDPTSWG